MSETVLRARGLSKTFGRGEGLVQAVDGLPQGSGFCPSGAAFSPDGTLLAVGDENGNICIRSTGWLICAAEVPEAASDARFPGAECRHHPPG